MAAWARHCLRFVSHPRFFCAAAQEPLLTDTYGELKAAFPKLQFRKARADAAAIKPTGGAGLTRGTCRCTGWRELGHTRRLP